MQRTGAETLPPVDIEVWVIVRIVKVVCVRVLMQMYKWPIITHSGGVKGMRIKKEGRNEEGRLLILARTLGLTCCWFGWMCVVGWMIEDKKQRRVSK